MKIVLNLILLSFCLPVIGQYKKKWLDDFHVSTSVSIYNHNWIVVDDAFSSELLWENNIRTGALAYYKVSMDKLDVFAELRYDYTLGGKGSDVDRFNTGAKIASTFHSKRSSSAELNTGVYFFKSAKHRLGSALTFGYDYLRIRSEEIVELNSVYKIKNYGLSFLYQYEFKLFLKDCTVDLSLGLAKLNAIGTWNLIAEFEQPRSFEHDIVAITGRSTLKVCVESSLALNSLEDFVNNVRGREITYLEDKTIKKMNIEQSTKTNSSLFLI